MRYLYRFSAMTTPCELLFFELDKEKSDKIAQLVLQEVKRLEFKYNYFAPNSYLSQINSRKIKKLDKESLQILRLARMYYKKTSYIFDISVGTIKDLFQISKNIDELNRRKEQLSKYMGCEHISIKRDKIFFDNPYTKLDLGGFIKEYAVDRSVKIIKRGKIKHSLVNFGGDIYAIGRKPNNQKFKVGIKNPQDPTTIIKYIEIEDEAIATSASYERFNIIENKKFSHIISPFKQKNTPKSVTVIAKSCLESGIYSTSLMIEPDLKIQNKVLIL